MTPGDDARQLRRRHDVLVNELDRADPIPDEGSTTIVVKLVTQVTFPTAAGSYFACQRVVISGTEAEGSPVTLTTISNIFYVGNIGSTVPSANTYHLATANGARWLMEFNG